MYPSHLSLGLHVHDGNTCCKIRSCNCVCDYFSHLYDIWILIIRAFLLLVLRRLKKQIWIYYFLSWGEGSRISVFYLRVNKFIDTDCYKNSRQARYYDAVMHFLKCTGVRNQQFTIIPSMLVFKYTWGGVQVKGTKSKTEKEKLSVALNRWSGADAFHVPPTTSHPQTHKHIRK